MSNLVPQFAKLTINDDRPIDDTSDDDRNRIFVSTVPPILALPKGCLYSTLSSDALISQFLSNTVVPTKSVKGRLNIKKNLTPAEIGPVASSLITGDSIPFLINNFQFIFAVWMLFLTSKTLSRSADQAVIEAFDVLHELLTDKRDTRFLLRFAYVQLAEAIDALVKAAKENRHAGHLYKRDESVYIDVYLTAKGNPLKSPKLRNKLSEHKRMGRRWRQLTDPSPLLLFLYSDNAESVVYVLISTNIL